MKVLLIDVDSRMENLALMKVSAYHKNIGDTVELRKGLVLPNLFTDPDLVYLSCIFSWHRRQVESLIEYWDGYQILVGGTGFDPHVTLDSEVEKLKPDYSLYGQSRAVGFLSRGCPRHCPWCVVPSKEGDIYRIYYAPEVVGDKKIAIFLDNNFLFLEDYEKDLTWLAEKGTKIDFNQGMDARIVDEKAASLLAKCNWMSSLRFACDSLGQIPALRRTCDLLEKYGVRPSKVFTYVLIGFDGREYP